MWLNGALRYVGHMQDIQGNLDMLQQNQTENVRQLAQELVAAVEDSENQLQVPCYPSMTAQ